MEKNQHLPKALLVGIHKPEDHIDQVYSDLEELSMLLDTLGIQALHQTVQKRVKLSPAHVLGTGKVEELAQIAKDSGAHYVVIDHPLSGIQIKNLEKILGCQVLDRSHVILDIFAKNAKSKASKTQVEIARLEYMLPRMVGAWTHFTKQAGGNIAMRGAGEKQIEIDRRRARERISRLHKKLEVIKKERATQRKLRANELKVSLVGYTNSGKTTLMKELTQAKTEGDNKLFATLDASIRTIDPNTRPLILLSDTVGFIRKLPPGLVASFHSTLEEVLNSNLLLHVVDISSPHFEAQLQTTHEVLKEIGAEDIPSLIVFNKTDLNDNELLLKLLKKRYKNASFVSAYSKTDMKDLRQFIFNFFHDQFLECKVCIPFANEEILSLVHRSCIILESNYEDKEFASFTIRASSNILSRLQAFII